MIFKMAPSGSSWSISPAITPPPGFSTDFNTSLDATNTFITISHVGSIDGPIMAHDPMRQPWPSDASTTRFFLAEDGVAFWRKVGQALSTVKIIISGCDSGRSYFQAVANCAQIPVYGFVHSIAAGVPGVMRPYIKGIESGHVPPGIEKSVESTLSGGIIYGMPDP
jgi:hypothetical protein